MIHSPFRLSRLLVPMLAMTSVMSVVACGSSSEKPLATVGRSQDESLSVLLMSHDVEVGDSRIPIVVFLADEDVTRVDDRLGDLSFVYRYADDETFKPLPDVKWRAWPVRGGAYTGVPAFDRPGIWEFQVTMDSGDEHRVGSTFLMVEQDGGAPSVGEPAPVTVTKTASTVEQVQQISSAYNPDPRFYGISLDRALSDGRPTVVLFSTPAFCNSQTCGPQLDTLGELADQYEDRVDFIHVEIFDNIREMLDTGDSTIGEVSQPVNDWGLITEPWTFVIDSDGIIVARFEQFTTLEELTEAVALLGVS